MVRNSTLNTALFHWEIINDVFPVINCHATRQEVVEQRHFVKVKRAAILKLPSKSDEACVDKFAILCR